MGLIYVPSIVYACFVLHNISEIRGIDVDDDAVEYDRLQPQCAPDRLYSFNTAEGTHVRNIITLLYKEHIPH